MAHHYGLSQFLPVLFLLVLLLPCIPTHPIPPQAADPLLSQSRPSNTRVPIVLLHMYDSVSFFRRLGALTGSNKARYAARHGYEMVISVPGRTSGVLKQAACADATVSHGPDVKGKCWTEDKDFDIDHSRAPTFGKIKLALAACQGRDDAWLLWSDADAMIVNQTVPLESVIDDGYDLMLAYDWLMLNAGVLLLKCSPWTIGLLTQVYNARKFDTARALDQSGFQSHLDSLSVSDRDLHVKVLPKYAINVYTEEYRPGDFLLHMAGKLYEATEPGLVAIANQFDILSMVDDVEDIKAFFRSTRLLNYYSGTCKVNAGQRQHDCKPIDPRRILLNETLGSMSYPNRYRHVGLRYYWLGDWKDKYDVPGWNVKRRALPMPDIAPPGKEMPPLPLAAMHHDMLHDGDEGKPQAESQDDTTQDDKPDLGDGPDDDDKSKQNPPEIDHEAEIQSAQNAAKPINSKSDANADEEADVDDESEDSWPWWVRLLLIGLCSSATGGLVYVMRKRRQKFSKIQ